VSQAQTIDQQMAQLLAGDTADTANVLAFHDPVQRAGHFCSRFFREWFGLFCSPHSLDAGAREMVHGNEKKIRPAAADRLRSWVGFGFCLRKGGEEGSLST
jgi:hypothetical protein